MRGNLENWLVNKSKHSPPVKLICASGTFHVCMGPDNSNISCVNRCHYNMAFMVTIIVWHLFWRGIKGVREIKRRLNDSAGFLGGGASCCIILYTSSDQVFDDLGALVGNPGGVQEAPAGDLLRRNLPQHHPKAVHVHLRHMIIIIISLGILNLRHDTAQVTGGSPAVGTLAKIRQT